MLGGIDSVGCNREYSLSFLCGISQTRLDALLIECDFMHLKPDIATIRRDISQFLEASVAGTEFAEYRVSERKKEVLCSLVAFEQAHLPTTN
jgi:hypothetical protein